MNTVQFTDKELAPLRRCIEGHELNPSEWSVTHHYAVNCGTVNYRRIVGSSNIHLQISKRWNTVRKDVDPKAPIYHAVIRSDNTVEGHQEAIDVIADTVGR